MKLKITVILSLYILSFFSCNKFLDQKPLQSLAVASSLDDFQALLDHHPSINNVDPGAGEISADDYYLTDALYNGLNEYFRRMYTWEPALVFSPISNDWYNLYRPPYRCNLILEELQKIEIIPSNQQQWNDIKGQAHFIRAKCLLQASLIWTLAYNRNNAANMLGLPIRLSSDFNEASVRSNLLQTYEQIISDARQAISHLPISVKHYIRPNKSAALALLARTFMAMGEYDSCYKYADEALKLSDTLLDYNLLNHSLAYPFQDYSENENPEIQHLSYIPSPAPINASRARIDSNLCKLYAVNDLRKDIFLKSFSDGSYSFKGSYYPKGFFSGIANDEVYLMKAECLARKGETNASLDVLNSLLIKRWKTGSYVPYTAINSEEALSIILQERRKELLMRGLRFMDLKRLNLEGANISIARKINGSMIILPPNSLLYALPIPEDIIEISGMTQNPR